MSVETKLDNLKVVFYINNWFEKKKINSIQFFKLQIVLKP